MNQEKSKGKILKKIKSIQVSGASHFYQFPKKKAVITEYIEAVLEEAKTELMNKCRGKTITEIEDLQIFEKWFKKQFGSDPYER